MLGKYDGGGATSYITKAEYGYSNDDMFKLFNEAFLDDGINAGKTFQFSHNPINDTGALGKALEIFNSNISTFNKVGY